MWKAYQPRWYRIIWYTTSSCMESLYPMPTNGHMFGLYKQYMIQHQFLYGKFMAYQWACLDCLSNIWYTTNSCLESLWHTDGNVFDAGITSDADVKSVRPLTPTPCALPHLQRTMQRCVALRCVNVTLHSVATDVIMLRHIDSKP